MAKNYDDIGGVWRTIGGRRVFIKDGQDLASAMIASGKFKNLRSEYKKAKEEENKKEKQEWDKSDEDMLKSIYTYSNEEKDVEKDSYYKDLVDKYGKESVASKYKELQDKYDIVANTYTDSEGVTYNSLKEKEKKDVNEPSIHTQSGSYTPNELKNRDESIKQMYKDAWEGKKSYKELNDELEGLKKDGKVSQGELDALKYDASLETGDWQNNPKNAHNSEYIGDNKVKLKEESSSKNWQEQIKANNAKMEKDVTDLQNKINDYRNKSIEYRDKDALKSYQYLKEADNLTNKYYERFRENERANAKIKVEEPNEKYMNVEAYAGYKEKFNKTWGADGSGEKTVSAKMYTNDEFMEHLEDANWHSERKALLDANLTNKELSYIKDRTKVSAWGVENLTGKEQVEKLIKEAKSQNNSINNSIRQKAYQKYLKEHPNSKMTFNEFKDMRK